MIDSVDGNKALIAFDYLQQIAAREGVRLAELPEQAV
jgi:hypothetical protein